MKSRIIRHPLLTVLWYVASYGPTSYSYVTAPRGVLPIHRQKAYLESLTNEILLSEPGSLPPAQIRDTIPRLMDAWACHPITTADAILQSASTNPTMIKGGGLQYSLTIEKLLKRLIDERYASPEEIAIHTQEYNALLTSWARTSTEHCRDVEVAMASAIRATSILVQMQEMYETQGTTQPDEISFRTVLSAWGGVAVLVSSDSTQLYHVASHLQSILEWMVDLCINGKNLEVNTVLLDRELFHSVMALMSKASVTKYAGIRSIEQCERMLHKMELLSEYERNRLKSANNTVSPDTNTYNFVLQAWSKADTIADSSTTSILNRQVVANRAYQIFHYMERFSHVEPNQKSYSCVIHALAKSGTKEHVMKASDIILKMENRFLQTGRTDMLPTTMCYNNVINSLAKCKDFRGIPHLATKVFQRMKRLYEDYDADVCKPDVFTYTSVISAYAFVSGNKNLKRKSFYMAMDQWKDLKSNPNLGFANQVTYGTLLRACANLLPESTERDEAVRLFFEECKVNGFLTPRIVDQVQTAASTALYQELMASCTTN